MRYFLRFPDGNDLAVFEEGVVSSGNTRIRSKAHESERRDADECCILADR